MRASIGRPSLYLTDIATASEPVRTMIEIIAIEFVDAHANRAGRDERVEHVFRLVEETECG